MLYALRHNCAMNNKSQKNWQLVLLYLFPKISFVIMRLKTKDFIMVYKQITPVYSWSNKVL